MSNLIGYLTQTIDKADEQAAAERVAALRQAHPEATTEELVEMLIKHKSTRTGAVGAVTSGASMIPGLGTIVSLTFGVAADIGMTFKMQAELVLEIAAVYRHQLSSTEKRNAILLVTGISAGANQLLSQTGTRIAEKTTERLAQKSVTKAIPVLGVAASAGTNMLSTYVIGRRAQAYFDLGPEAVGDWAESVRAISGMDERKLISWLAETTEHSWSLVRDRAHSAAGATIVASKSAGHLVVISADKTGQAVAGAGKSIAKGASTAVETSVNLGKRAGAGIAAGANRAGEAAKETGRSVAQKTSASVAAGANRASEMVSGARQGLAGRARATAGKARAGVAARADRAGEAVKGAGKGVATRADAARTRFSKTLDVFKRDKTQAEDRDRGG